MQYVQDYDETYPVDNRTYLAPAQSDSSVVQASWIRHIQSYSKNLDIFRCPDTPVDDDLQKIYGVGGTTADQITVSRRSLGANGLLVYAANDPTGNYTQPVPQASVGRTADLPVIADSSSFLWTDPRYLMFASYVGANRLDSVAWAGAELTAAQRATPDPKYARHNGGTNILYGDGHAKWAQSAAVNTDPTRTKAYFQLNYKLPISPVDCLTSAGAIRVAADDRLQ